MSTVQPIIWALVVVQWFMLAAAQKESRVSSLIYVPVEHKHMCFRITNGTNQIGCQSSRDGNVGVVVVIENMADIEALKKVADETSNNYILAVDALLMNDRDLMGVARTWDRVAGVLVLYNQTTIDARNRLSADYSCPNPKSSIYKTSVGQCGSDGGWNPGAIGVWFKDWPKPVAVIRNETDIVNIRDKCYKHHNEGRLSQVSRALCAAKMKNFMHAALSTPSCLRRNDVFTGLTAKVRKCDQLSDSNIVAVLPVLDDVVEPDSVLLIVARMDSLSMFADLSYGAESTLSSIVLLSVLVKSIADFVENYGDLPSNRRVAFALFTGESLDYIGSSRTVYDMAQGRFPADISFLSIDDRRRQSSRIDLSHVAHIVELNQLGLLTPGGAFVAHRDRTAYEKSGKTIDALFGKVQSHLTGYSLKWSDNDGVLPPSSLHAFFRHDARNISHMLLSAYDNQYLNRFYNGFADTPDHITDPEEVKLALFSMAQSLALTIGDWLTNSKVGAQPPSVDQQKVSALYDCFVTAKNWASTQPADNCAQLIPIMRSSMYLVRQLVRRYQSRSEARTYMQAAEYDSAVNLVAKIWWILETATSVDNVTTSDTCYQLNTPQSPYSYYWISDNTTSWTDGAEETFHCARTPIYVTNGMSPAFDIEDYDWTSGEWPSWAESVWMGDSFIRLFLQPPAWLEYTVFAVGVAVFVVSYLVVWAIDTKSSVLFGSHSGEGVV